MKLKLVFARSDLELPAVAIQTFHYRFGGMLSAPA
jgi:hypothetical protein